MLASCVVRALSQRILKRSKFRCVDARPTCFNQHHHHHRHHGDVLASSIGENDQEEPHGGEDGWLHIADIAERTKIDDGELKRALQSLACGGRCVLTKEPKSRRWHTDRFSFNASFTSKALSPQAQFGAVDGDITGALQNQRKRRAGSRLWNRCGYSSYYEGTQKNSP